jgi:hypothetical protein
VAEKIRLYACLRVDVDRGELTYQKRCKTLQVTTVQCTIAVIYP